MKTLTQITSFGKRLQLDTETYAEVNQAEGLISIYQGQRIGEMSDWGGKSIGYISLAHAIQVVKAALAMNEAADDEDAEIEEILRRYEEQQDARHDATSAHFGHD